jgi:Tfp pilus assembly protein PilV
MWPVAARHRNQRGETLLELLMAISILGTGVVALVGGIGTSILMSDVHRKEATADTVVRSYAESIESAVALPGAQSAYADCAGVDTYATPPGFTVPSGYTATVTAVQFWTGTAFAPAGALCTVDSGVQMLTLEVASTDTRASEKLELVVRKPCGDSDESCGSSLLSLAR